MPPKRKASAAPKLVTIRVNVAFNGLYKNDTADVVLDDRVQGWINAGLAAVIDGADQAGPGRSQQDDSRGVAQRTGGSSAAGHEPSQGFGSGGYGAPSSEHQGGVQADGDAAL